MSETNDHSSHRRLSRRDFLRNALIFSGALALTGFTTRRIYHLHKQDLDFERAQRYLGTIQPATDMQKLPNIILVFVDDLGYGDLGIFGSQAIMTPNLDKMASEGVQLTNFYSTAPLCSPARAGMLTGRYPIRTMVTGSLYPAGSPMNIVMDLAGFYTYGVHGIPEDELILPEILQQRGYRTVMLGKWHLGDRSPHLPNENGFDDFYGALYSNDMQPYRIYQNTKIAIDQPVDQKVLTQELTRRAVQHIHSIDDRPLFLYLAHPMPHEPLHASLEFHGRSNAGLYGDVVEEIDWSMGEILQSIKDQGLEENTLVIFTSDNGPWWQGNPGFARGRKNLPFEGGFRVPFVARWPGMLPAGYVCNEMSMNFDLLPTILQLAGIALPDDRIIDGKNVLTMWQGNAQSPHERLFFFKGHNLVGVRYHQMKYLRRHMTDNGGYTTLSQGPFLFNLDLDPNESYSLIESQPVMATKLSKMLDEFDEELNKNHRGWL